ncbi:MAG: RdgB/HAM1 family non-canonical purine NTP pyrophosphatase [Paludibacteraceae bacterium]|nr:RdgB/HAM1 family non-canonical purine NTP pyrophosphatase [Paludibacteraceae bacterium]
MKIVFASNNAHKLEEVRKILAPMEVLGLREVGFDSEIDEIGTTLEANSMLKAQVVWQWLVEQGVDTTMLGVFADDTGLEIAALGGAPGVYSARWAGEPSNDARNRQKALCELTGVQDRSARFRTVITWIDAQGAQQVEGIVNGRMAEEESGEGGFGYDALFIPEGHNATFAALPAEEKNAISHRARALHALRAILK